MEVVEKQELSQEQINSAVESLLFTSDRPISIKSLAASFEGYKVNTKDVQKAIQALEEQLLDSNRGIKLVEVSGGFQFRTKSENAFFLKTSLKLKPFKLTQSTLEVLSYVAYQQPVTKHQVDELRGVESGHLLRALMDKGLVSFKGKSELPGKPMLYGTTGKFLEIFGLKNIKELPTLADIDQLLPDGVLEESDEEKESLSVVASNMEQQFFGPYSDGEDELDKISEELKSIETATSFINDEKKQAREARHAERAKQIQDDIAQGVEVAPRDKKWLERYLMEREPVLNGPEVLLVEPNQQ